MKTTFQSIWGQRCPNCRIGKLFDSSFYQLKRFGQMKDHCDTCGHTFNPEPGFYTGAMYVSYAFQVGILAVVQLLFAFLYPDAGALARILTVVFFIALLFPIIFRLSRSIWIHLFISYREKSWNTQ